MINMLLFLHNIQPIILHDNKKKLWLVLNIYVLTLIVNTEDTALKLHSFAMFAGRK